MIYYPDKSIRLKFIPIKSALFRAISNQSEKRFVSRLMKKSQKSIRLNAIQPEASIRMNPNQCEPIRIILTSDSFVLILIENSVWINSNSDRAVLSRIDFEPFLSNETQNVFRIGLQ